MVGNQSFLKKKSFHLSCAPYSQRSLDDSSTIRFCRRLTLGRAKKYNHTTRVFQPMMPTFPSQNIVATLCQLHPFPSDLVPPLIFYYKLEHTFVLDRTLFAQALAIAPHLSLGELFGSFMNISQDISYQRTHLQGFRSYSKLLLFPMVIFLSQWPQC